VAGDQVPVLGRHQVRLDEIGTELDGERIALERVRRQVAVRAAMADHQGPTRFVAVAAAVGAG